MANGKNLTEILILNLLDSRPMYGAEMVEEIKKISGNSVVMSLPALYSSLHRLSNKRLVNSYQKQSTIGGRCRVYNITKYGREYLEDHPIEINYNITNNTANTADTINITNNITSSNVSFSTLENSISLPLNKSLETTNITDNNFNTTPTYEPIQSEQSEIVPLQNTEDSGQKQILNQASNEIQTNDVELTNNNPLQTEQIVPVPNKETKETKQMVQTSPYISPTDKIITSPEPQYQQTLIGLSGTVGGNDLRPLLKLNKIKVGNDYIMINRLRIISSLITTAIFVLINFICSLTNVVQKEYYNIVYIALAIYAFVNLAIYFVYPRIKVIFKRKSSGIRHALISLALLVLVLLFCFSSGTSLLWLIIFSFLPIVEFVFMLRLRNRRWFQC